MIPGEYELQEMPTASYPKRTEPNILDRSVAERTLASAGCERSARWPTRYLEGYCLAFRAVRSSAERTSPARGASHA